MNAKLFQVISAKITPLSNYETICSQQNDFEDYQMPKFVVDSGAGALNSLTSRTPKRFRIKSFVLVLGKIRNFN